MIRIMALTILVFFAVISECTSDTVTLKNNQSIDGVIVEENESYVILNLGCGTVTLERADIDSITRSDRAANKLMLDDWRKEYLDAFPAPTEADQVILEEFKDLRRQKGKVARKMAVKDDVVHQIHKLQRGLAQIQQERDEIGIGIKEANAKTDPVRYNELIVEFNSANSRLSKIINSIGDLQEEKDNINKELVGYISNMSTYTGRFEKVYRDVKKYESDPGRVDFYNGLKDKLKELASEITQKEVKFTDQGQGMVVTTHINNKHALRLLVDTGASMMTISRNAARKVGIDPDALKQEISLVLADGSTSKAKYVLLESVRVGNVEAKNVSAAVISDEPTLGIDGLLGMSFLGNFSFSMDTKNQRLIFQSLD